MDMDGNCYRYWCQLLFVNSRDIVTFPVGTVYAVFVGLGTAGTTLSGIVIFEESVSVAKLLLISLLLVGVIGIDRYNGQSSGRC